MFYFESSFLLKSKRQKVDESSSYLWVEVCVDEFLTALLPLLIGSHFVLRLQIKTHKKVLIVPPKYPNLQIQNHLWMQFIYSQQLRQKVNRKTRLDIYRVRLSSQEKTTGSVVFSECPETTYIYVKMTAPSSGHNSHNVSPRSEAVGWMDQQTSDFNTRDRCSLFFKNHQSDRPLTLKQL